MAATKMKYEVWVGGRMIGKRQSDSGRDYTHAIIAQVVSKWDKPDPYTLPGAVRDDATYKAHTVWLGTRVAAELGAWTVLSFARSAKLAIDRLNEFKGGGHRNVTHVPVTVVQQWTKIDSEGYPFKSLVEAAEEFLDFFRDYVGGPAWDELTGANGEAVPPALAVLQNALQREAEKGKTKTQKLTDVHGKPFVSTYSSDTRRGELSDDLGESNDY